MTLPAIINITAPINLTLTKTINSLWYADMELEQNDYITPECYVEFDNELYIVRIPNDIIDKNKLTQQIRLEHNMTELNDFGIGPFIWATKTAAEMLALALANTDWTIGTVSGPTGTSTVESKKRITVLAAIMLIVNTFLGEVNFNSKLRTVDLKDEIGTQTKLQVRYDKNAEYIKRTRNSQNLVTRLYCYGKENLTISSVNGGLAYLDSTHISDYKNIKEKSIYTNIDDAARLKAYAQIYLNAYENILYTYAINILDRSVFPEWVAEEINLGDTLRVYNKDIGINVDVRVKEFVKDLVRPNRIQLTLNNYIDRITDILEKLNYAIDSNTYQNEPDTFIPPIPEDNYDQPIPIQGIYTVATNVASWAGTLTSEREITRDGNGYFHAVWQAGTVNNENIFYGKSVDDGRTWTVQQITTPDALYQDFDSPSLAIDSLNNIYIVCAAGLGSRINQNILYVSTDNGATFGAVIEVPFTGYWNSAPSIGVDKNDVVHILNLRYYAGGSVYHISTVDKGSNWSSQHLVLDSMQGNIRILDTGCVAFEISHDANSVMHVGIKAIVYVPTDTYHIIYLNSSDGGATWIHQEVLNKDVNNNASVPKFAVGNHNYSLYFCWCEIVSGVSNIYFNTCTNDVWGTPELVSDGINNCYEPTVSLDTNDKVYVSWTSIVETDSQIKIRTRVEGSWEIEFTRTTSTINKKRPHLVHAQNPIINGLKSCVIYDGFAMMYEEYAVVGSTSDMKFWIDCSAIF